jgi:hypothetical protein
LKSISFIVFLSINKKQMPKIMKQTRNQWVIIPLCLFLSTSVSAQNYWLPMPKEWVLKMITLLVAAKKMPIQHANVGTACPTFSNEITISISPCSDGLKKAELVEAKPVQ